MRYFEKELRAALSANGIVGLEAARGDGFIHFIHLYAKIVEDCPLVMTHNNHSATVAKVTLKVDFFAVQSPSDLSDDVVFRVRWIIEDRDGQTGEIYVINSFSKTPDESPAV